MGMMGRTGMCTLGSDWVDQLPGKNLLPVTQMLIIECINKKNSKQIEASST